MSYTACRMRSGSSSDAAADLAAGDDKEEEEEEEEEVGAARGLPPMTEVCLPSNDDDESFDSFVVADGDCGAFSRSNGERAIVDWRVISGSVSDNNAAVDANEC